VTYCIKQEARMESLISGLVMKLVGDWFDKRDAGGDPQKLEQLRREREERWREYNGTHR
jgi:hypothetical protein